MENSKPQTRRVYLSSRKPPKDAKVLKGEQGASYYITDPTRRKPSTFLSKVVLPSGKIKYTYLKGETPQAKYSRSEKGIANEKKRRNSPKRKEYLKNYYLKHSDMMKERNSENYRRRQNKSFGHTTLKCGYSLKVR